MKYSLRLAPSDRILFFAPHPDDESLGGGGLVQKAVEVGAQMRFVFVTNGDRNPWPQRVMERRVFLDAKARRSWGARRKREALAALAVLGIGEPADAHFLNWPDQGVMPLLMSANAEALEAVCSMVAEWRPTYIISPAAEDTHPDHSAFFVLLQIALDRLRRQGIPICRVLSYLVHVPKQKLTLEIRPLGLSFAQVAVKAGAIETHESQMLSRKRFLAHAQIVEEFRVPLKPRSKHPHHPIVGADRRCGSLRLKLQLPKALICFYRARIHLVIETILKGSLRWSLTLPSRSATAIVTDTVSGQPLRLASIRIEGRSALVSLPIAAVQPLDRLFAKFERRPLFFDIAGWRELPVDSDFGSKMRPHGFDAARHYTFAG